MTIRVSRKAWRGWKVGSSKRFAVTNSMEPAKMNMLINRGYHTENPWLRMRNP